MYLIHYVNNGVRIELPLERIDKLETELCRILVRTGAIKFGLFKLTSGKLSPYYIDLRTIPSFPSAFKTIVSMYETLIKKEIGLKSFDRIGCVPIAGIAFASVIAIDLDKPLLCVRKEAKEHGRKRRIEGLLEPGDKILLIDDLITTGKNMIEAVNSIRSEGGIVEKGLALIDRQESGVEKLKEMNVTVHTFMHVSELAKKLLDIGILDGDKYKDIIEQIKECAERTR